MIHQLSQVLITVHVGVCGRGLCIVLDVKEQITIRLLVLLTVYKNWNSKIAAIGKTGI